MFKKNKIKGNTGQNPEVPSAAVKIEKTEELADVKQETSEATKIKLEPMESDTCNPTKIKTERKKSKEEKQSTGSKLNMTEKLQLHISKAAASIGQLPIVGQSLHDLMSNIFVSDNVCQVCKRNFSSKQRLTTHMRTHTHERPYKCASCDDAFARTDHLKNHVTNIHTQEKNFQCEVCSYKCTTKYALTVHMRKHSKEKPFKCDICDKQFPYKNSLSVHRQSHSKERNTYRCGMCGSSFDYRSNLNRHIKSVHVKTI